MTNEIKLFTTYRNTRIGFEFIVTSVNEKRVNMDEPGAKSISSTGRTSSKFYMSKKRFNAELLSGEIIEVK